MFGLRDQDGLRRWVFVAAAAYLLLLVLEIATEQDNLNLFDIVADALALLLTVVTACGLVIVALRLEARNRDIRHLVAQNAATQADRERWRAKAQTHLKGLSAALDEEFENWELTPAEMDVGRLLLKGLSHRQIADLRNTSEQTVRQQAQGIYQKSGLHGKAEFSAYFLDALFTVEPAVETPS